MTKEKSYLAFLERKGRVHVKEFDHETKTRQWVAHDFAPKIFVPTDRNTGIRSIDDKNLEPLNLPSIPKAREFVRELGDAAADLYGYRKFDVQFITQAGYKDATPEMFSIVYHDIETEVHDGFPDPTLAKEPINMITLIQRNGKAFGLTTCKVKAELLEEKFKDIGIKVEVFETEESMLIRFIEIFTKVLDTDIFCGWNSEKFDMPFIVNRIINVLGKEYANRLSPFGEVFIRSFTDDFGEEAVTAEIVGVLHADMIPFYKKFNHEARESYSLDNIAMVELGVGKLHHESGIPGHLLYHNYPTEGLEYNIIDVVRLMQIDMKKGILDLAIIVANMTKSNVSDCVFSTRLWMNMIYDYLDKKNMYFSWRSVRKPYRKIEGGYVMAPKSGLYEFGGSFDYASLYPSTMMALNISPDVRDIKVPNIHPDRLLDGEVHAPPGLSMGGNGQCYRTDKKGFLTEIIEHGYGLRKSYKAEKIKYEHLKEEEEDKEKKKEYERLYMLYKNYDSSIKTILNSCYGALAEKNFHFYDPDMAESITVTGQFMVRNLGKTFDEMLKKNFGYDNYWITSDTDSCYINFKKAVETVVPNLSEEEQIDWLCKFADGPMKKVVKIANKSACEILNAYEPQHFDADREAVFRRGVFVKKKMYALALSDMEGVRYKEPKLKIVGLSAKKSSTPSFFRDKMQEFFKRFLNGDTEGAIQHMIDIENEFREAQIDKIASNASVSDVTSKVNENSHLGYDKGTHINARAAIVHNMLINRDETARMYIEPIVNGDKIKMLPLKLPNPVNENIISWKDEWPKYFDDINMRKYIDWKTHFAKAFRKPLDTIFAACGINPTVSEPLDIF